MCEEDNFFPSGNMEWEFGTVQILPFRMIITFARTHLNFLKATSRNEEGTSVLCIDAGLLDPGNLHSRMNLVICNVFFLRSSPMFRGSIPRGFRFSGQRFIIIAVADVNKNSNITEKCSLKFIQDVCVKKCTFTS